MSRSVAAAGALGALLAAACAAALLLPRTAPAAAAPNPGRFVVECTYSHSAADDPIVFPGEPGASHLHDFFGNVAVDAFSTADSIAATDTTCAQRQDRASYWAPALFRGDEQVVPVSSDAYYRAAPGVDPAAVQPYPFGLMMIGGDHRAPGFQDTDVVGWGCGRNPRLTATPHTCGPGSPLTMHVRFQDCWNGVDLDSPDHRSHVARSEGGTCPDSHPVHIPQLEFVIVYPFSGDPSGLRLDSGPTSTAHADFLNAWEPEKLANEIDHCIELDAICGVPSI